MRNQLTRGEARRLTYIENKDGEIEGADARVGWVEFSKTGLTVYYRGRELRRSRGGGIRGNYFDAATGEEYWISGLKMRGSNVHRAESALVTLDADAVEAYRALKAQA